MILFVFFAGITIFLLTACSSSKKGPIVQAESYVPQSKELYDAIVIMGSIWGDAYNTCKIRELETIHSDSLEMYHDKGGLSTFKESDCPAGSPAFKMTNLPGFQYI